MRKSIQTGVLLIANYYNSDSTKIVCGLMANLLSVKDWEIERYPAKTGQSYRLSNAFVFRFNSTCSCSPLCSVIRELINETVELMTYDYIYTK